MTLDFAKFRLPLIKRSEATRLTRIELLATLMSQTALAQMLFDQNGLHLFSNERAISLLALDRSVLNAINCLESPLCNLTEQSREVELTLEDGIARTFEKTERSAGRDLNIQRLISRIEIQEQHYLLIQFIDFTENRLLESALQTSDDQLSTQIKLLAESESRFKLAMDAAEEGIWDWRVDTGDVYYSPSYARMLGFDPASFPRHVNVWFDLMHPDDVEQTRENSARLLKTSGLCTMEFRMRHIDGSYRWILSNGKVIERDETGNPIRVIGTHIDITRRKSDEALLQKATESAQAAKEESEKILNDQRQFLRMISHEIRNPLAVIDSAVQVLELDATNNQRTLNLIGRIKRGTSRLMNFINQCISDEKLSHLKAHGLEYSREELELSELLHSVVNQVRTTAAAHKIDVVSELGTLYGDGSLLRMLLLNLINNAIQYSPPGSEVIVSGAFLEDDKVTLVVTDNGNGMDQEELAGITGSYVRGKNSAQSSGLGLGLSLVETVVSIHHGSLDIKSQLGLGTTVTVTLPNSKT